MRNIHIRRAQWSDRERIFDFYRQSYPDWERRIPHRWDWQMTNNPYRPEGPPTVWLAVNEQNEVVGQTMAVMEPIFLDGKVRLLGWSVDAFVAADLRGQGLGRQLKEAMQQDLPLVMSISMADAIRHINVTQGALELPVLTTYLLNVDARQLTQVLSRSAGSLLGSVIRGLNPGALLATRINAGAAHRRQAMKKDAQNVDFVPIDQFPAEVDSFWEKASNRYTGAVVRTHRYLNWKYYAQPNVAYQSFLIFKEKEMQGYIILREGSQRGTVVDLILEPQNPSTAAAALDFAVQYYRRKNIHEVRGGSSLPWLKDCLARCGWNRPVLERTPLLHIRNGNHPSTMQDGLWLFGLGDHDQQQ